jgi:hypothetical protein
MGKLALALGLVVGRQGLVLMAIGEAEETDSYARTLRVRAPHWAAQAWGAFALAVLFVGLTCWWLTQDRSIPIFDAGVRLYQSIEVYQQIAQGHFGSALTWTTPYPPVVYLVGGLGIWAGWALRLRSSLRTSFSSRCLSSAATASGASHSVRAQAYWQRSSRSARH